MIDWIGTTNTAAAALVTWWLRGAALLALAALAARLLRNRSAAWRHLAWSLAVAAVLVLPAVSVLVPSWTVPVALPLEAADAIVPTVPDRAPQDTGQGPVLENASAAEVPGSATAAPASRSSERSPAAGPAPVRLPVRAAALVALWLAGVLFLGARAAFDRRARRRMVRRAVEAPEAAEELAAARFAYGTRRHVRILLGPGAAVPMTWGVLRPIVVLPADAKGWSGERRRQVVLHELAHVVRLDALWQGLAEILCALAWIDPLAWMARRGLRREAEHACDDAVLAVGVRPSHYAGNLLQAARDLRARRRSWAPAPAAVAMARTPALGGRICAVLEEGRKRRPPSSRQAFGGLLVAGCLLLPLAVVTPEASASPTPADEGSRSHSVHETSEPGEGYFTQPRFAGRCEPGVFTDRTFGSRVEAEDDEWAIEILHGRCSLEIEMTGEIEFRRDARGIARMARGARMTIEEDAEVDRKLVVVAGPDGSPRYRWSVDGARRPIDDAARRWFRAVVPEILRATGLQARERVAYLLERGGVPAVLDEIGRMPSDHVAGRYFAETLGQRRLSPAEAVAVLERAGEVVGSDHQLGLLMTALPSGLLNERTVQDAYIEAARQIGSDHETGRVLHALLERPELSRATLERLLEIADAIGSDHESGRLLLALLDRFPAGGALPPSFFRVADDIGSDHELGRVLRAVIDGGRTDEATVAAVLRAAEGIGADHELASLLVRIAEEAAPTGALRERYLEVAEEVGSRSERERVLAAVGADPRRGR